MSEIPETYHSIELPILRAALRAAELGLEYAAEAIAVHDVSLGRTTIKNKRMAEMMEQDIQHMKSVIENLKGRLHD